MHAFDGGSPAALFTALAEGYLALLAPLHWRKGVEATPRGPYFRTLRQLLRRPDESILETGGHDITGPLPSCLVEVGEGRTVVTQPDHLIWEVDVRVHVIAGHEAMDARGRLAVDDSAGRDTTNDPGIYVMLQHVIEQLHWQKPCTQAMAIRITGTSYGADTPRWSWWAVDTRVECRQNIWRAREATLINAIESSTESPVGGDELAHEEAVLKRYKTRPRLSAECRGPSGHRRGGWRAVAEYARPYVSTWPLVACCPCRSGRARPAKGRATNDTGQAELFTAQRADTRRLSRASLAAPGRRPAAGQSRASRRRPLGRSRRYPRPGGGAHPGALRQPVGVRSGFTARSHGARGAGYRRPGPAGHDPRRYARTLRDGRAADIRAPGPRSQRRWSRFREQRPTRAWSRWSSTIMLCRSACSETMTARPLQPVFRPRWRPSVPTSAMPCRDPAQR